MQSYDCVSWQPLATYSSTILVRRWKIRYQIALGTDRDVHGDLLRWLRFHRQLWGTQRGSCEAYYFPQHHLSVKSLQQRTRTLEAGLKLALWRRSSTGWSWVFVLLLENGPTFNVSLPKKMVVGFKLELLGSKSPIQPSVLKPILPKFYLA